MATLALTTDEILRALCLVAGVDRDPGELDATTQADFRLMIRTGLRGFYHLALDEKGNAHTWRFLERPYSAGAPTDNNYDTGTVTVSATTATLAGGTWPTWAADGVLHVDGQRVYVASRDSGTVLTLREAAVVAAAGSAFVLSRYKHPLPADFAEFIGGVLYQSPQASRKLAPVTDTEIRLRYAVNYRLGDTRQYAIQSYAGATAPESDWYIEFWPPMDDEASASGTYRASPADELDDDDLTLEPAIEQIGPLHAATLLEAILAAAEEFYLERPGVHAQKFQGALLASIKHDLATPGPIGGGAPANVDPRRLSLLYHTPDYSDAEI